MDFTWEKLTSREFEIIACNFANDMFSSYQWKLTNSTRDDNHDFYAETSSLNKWGEAKHSTKYNKTISRSQWDPTLVSAKLINSVNDILLITCAYIPLSYVIRSFHMTISPITNIYCINRLLLNEWYRKKQPYNLSAFNTKMSIEVIRKKINRLSTNTFSLHNNEMKFYIFDNIEKNYLTVLRKLIPCSEYIVNIALFAVEDNVNFNIKLGEYISIIDNVTLRNLSIVNEKKEIIYSSENTFTCEVSKGYSVIEFHIITRAIISNNVVNYIESQMGDLNERSNILIVNQNEVDRNLLIEIEEMIKVENNQNRIIHTKYITTYSLKKPNFKFIYISFDERYNLNNAKLCRLFSFFVLGIDFQELDEISLKDNIYLSDYPEYLENIILGIYSDSVSIENIKYSLNNIDSLLLQYNTPSKVIYIIENSFNLNEEQKGILKNIEYTFESRKDNCFMIFQNNLAKPENIIYNNDLALIGIFETGVRRKYINNKKLLGSEDFIIMDIDEALYFPSSKMNIMDIKSFVLSKTSDALQDFFEKILNIVSKQIWASRVLDFILLIKNNLSNEIISKMVRGLRDIYYKRTDFNTAYHYSKILCETPSPNIEQNIDDKYKEADELNHCGSIIESRKIFSKVSEEILARQDFSHLSKGLEALTEVYNISFWILDVKDLEQKIDQTINKYFPNGVNNLSDERDLYPYYNCLNRKMVVQYFLGHYSEAEKTFKMNLEIITLDNYIAFALMDSARGLYNKDIHEAYKRIKQAAKVLKKLFKQKKEIRRYYDCLIEKAYIEFILSTPHNRSVQDLCNAVLNAQKYGYRNIVQKSYFKLAACYMVLGDIKQTEYYLQRITNNSYFRESPRNQLMYNELMKGYYYLLNNKFYDKHNVQSDFCNTKQSVEFKCFEYQKDKVKEENKFFIETRMW